MRIRFFALAALALSLAACTQDEAGFLPEGAEGTPIVFTATGLNPAATATAGTRAPVDGNWEGVQSVAVLMDGTVKAYDVTPTNATLTSTDPHYWTNHKDITVTAWWPYTAGETSPPAVKVKANQSARKDFEGSDLIVADGQTVTYGSPTLRFTHRTARVTIVLTDYTEESMGVQLTGLSTEGGNPAEIIPYDKGSNTYTALVAPQSVAAGTAFITCTFTNGKTFVYKMKNATDWQAGGEYTYTVSLAAAKDLGYTIESNGSYTVYNADGLLNVAELVNGGKTDINITLDKNIDLTGKDWTPIGTDYDNSYKGTFDGGGHTITGLTFTTNDEYAGLFGWLNRAGTVKNVVMYPDLYRRILDAGHRIGNHTYSHQKGWGMSLERYIEDVDFANDLVRSELFRPPYARITPAQARALGQRYKLVMWDVLSRDYNRRLSPRTCLNNVTKYLAAGSIVVFHDSEKSFRNMRYALPRTLEKIRELGLKCKSIGL